jgi:two-component system, chemotaxis family, chemotaxis protein CheY
MKRQILIVDDSASMRQVVSFTLQQAGHAVIDASSGQEALQKLAANSVDLVLTDLNMPGMDGLSLVKAIRSQPAHKFTPILFLTTDASPARKAEGKAAGATGWLVKPFVPEQLLAVLKRVLP